MLERFLAELRDAPTEALPTIVLRMVMVAVTLAAAGCSGDPTRPGGGCEGIKSVDPTVSTGASVVFDWSPACGVARLFAEKDDSDQWSINTPQHTWDTPSEANQIFPPITYGQAPAGVEVEEDFPAEELVAGQAYRLLLWRMLRPGEDRSGCLAGFDNGCLVAVHEFVR